MENIANRGKEAETLVKKYLTQLAKKAEFTFYRFPDARAGSLQSAPADFLLLNKGHMTLLEVKEVAHSYRLPHRNVSQIPKLTRHTLAGASAFVLVYFKPEKLWRIAPVSYFSKTEGASWDMRDIQLTSLEACITVILESGK